MLRYVLSAGLLAATIGAVEAAPKCSPGKIYRVSKKVCVDKTAAIRDGVISARQKASAARAAAAKVRTGQSRIERARVSSRATEARPGSDEGAAGARTVILAPVKNVIGWAKSPFGALVDPWTSDDFNASPETRFSLRLTTEN